MMKKSRVDFPGEYSVMGLHGSFSVIKVVAEMATSRSVKSFDIYKASHH